MDSEIITNGHSEPVAPERQKQQKYFRQWYRVNRDWIADKRKKRYLEDPEYRQKCLEATRRYAAERAERRKLSRLERAHDPTPITGDLAPVGREISIEVDGAKVKTKVYRVGELQRRLQRSRASITNWLKLGILPKARLATASGFRLYTQEEVDCIVQTYTDVGMHAMIPGSIQAFRRLIAARWQMLPDGVGNAWREIHAPPLPEVVELRA